MTRRYPRLMSQVIFAVENLLPDYSLQSLRSIINSEHLISINVYHNKTM